MQKYYTYNLTIVYYYFVVTVILIQNLNFTHSATPKDDFVFDGLVTDWNSAELSLSTGSGSWGISWNSTCIFIVYDNPTVSQWNGSIELVLVFDLNPKLSPTSGHGSLYTQEFSGNQHSLPFSGDLLIQISPDTEVATTFTYDNVTLEWINYTQALVTVKTSPGAAEIVIDYANNTDLNNLEFNFKQFYFLGYAQTVTTVFDITPDQGNQNASGSGNRTLNGYWAFMSIDGVEPANPVHMNTFSTQPGNSAYYLTPLVSGTFNWTGNWWGLPSGVYPTPKSVVYIPKNYTLQIDSAGTAFALLNIGGKILVETTSFLNLAPGGLFSNFGQCCDNVKMNLKLLGSATFRNGQITDLFNVLALTGTVMFDEFSFIHGNLKILNADVTSSPMYQSGSTLQYSTNNTFSRNEEWNSTISPPKTVIIDTNTRLVLGTNNGQFKPHTVLGDLIIFPGSILDLDAAPALQAALNIQGDLQNNGSLILSSNSGSDLIIQGNYSHQGSLSRNLHDFFCPNITWTKVDSYCYQDNGTVTVAASGGFPPISFLWTFPNGTTDSGPTLEGLAAGRYNVTFVESNADGCPTTSFDIDISSGQCPTTTGYEDDSSGVNTSTIAIAIAITVGGTLVVLGTMFFISRLSKNRKKVMQEQIMSLPMEEAALSISVINIPTKFSSVKDVGVSTEQNPRWRRTMEDEHLIIDKFGGEENAGYFAVYDGHGGREIAEFVASRLHKSVLTELENCYQINPDHNKNATIAQAFRTAYLNTDELVRNEDTRAGSTAVTAYVRMNADNERWLYVANCGDARAVLSRNGVAARLSMDHKPTEETEAARIKNDGGWIVQGKVAGMLAVTRAFGDNELKKWVTADPYITETQLKATDTILIVACDGLWDVVDDQTCMDFVQPLYNTDTAQQIADKLLRLAMDKGTRDNVSIIVVKL